MGHSLMFYLIIKASQRQQFEHYKTSVKERCSNRNQNRNGRKYSIRVRTGFSNFKSRLAD